MNVSNGKTIRRLGWRSMKAAKTRNLIAILAILAAATDADISGELEDAALTDETGKLVAIGTYTFFVTQRQVEDTALAGGGTAG